MSDRAGLVADRAMAPTAVRWRLFAFIFILTVVNLADRTSISVGMPTIAKEFGLSPGMQGVILSSFFWTYAALQVPGGWVIDRAGPSRVITGATLGWGVFQTLAMFATSGVFLLLTRLGLGVAEAPLFPAGGKLVALWMARHERGRGAVLMDSGSYLGAAIGGVSIAWLIYALDSWRLAFGIAGMLTILLGLFAWRMLRDDPAAHPAVERRRAVPYPRRTCDGRGNRGGSAPIQLAARGSGHGRTLRLGDDEFRAADLGTELSGAGARPRLEADGLGDVRHLRCRISRLTDVGLPQRRAAGARAIGNPWC